jgi:GNAT superfamily N-acetyltransferase
VAVPPSPQIDAAERNYVDAWRFLIENIQGAETVETDDVVLLTVPMAIAYFNSAFVKPAADPVTCIDAVRSFYGERERPFTLRFRDRDTAAVEAAGLVADGTSPLMVVDIAEVAPPEADVHLVDVDTWDGHIATMADGFGMPIEIVKAVFGRGLASGDGYIGFNAVVDGQIVSTAALMITGDVAGVYNVATPEAYRRRGLGEATTRAAVVEGARRGCTLATLQSSAMGLPIYERVGFRTIGNWRAFTDGAA